MQKKTRHDMQEISLIEWYTFTVNVQSVRRQCWCKHADACKNWW